MAYKTMASKRYNIEIDKFITWITDRGVEILPTTNEYEEVRFKGKEVGILYKSGRVSNAYTSETINAFKKNKQWYGKPINVGRKVSYKKEKKMLLKRDGTKCFYCDEEMHDDITLEHLIPLSSGGKNSLGNMALCHYQCNEDASNKTLIEKIKIVISKRINK